LIQSGYRNPVIQIDHLNPSYLYNLLEEWNL